MSEEHLQRYLDGRMDDAERRSFEQELLVSETAVREAYDEMAVREAVARHAKSLRRPPAASRAVRPRWVWPTAGAAAVALLAWLLLWPTPPETTTYRGKGAVQLELLAPRGPVTEAPEFFRWTTHPEAQSYRFEFYDSSGEREFSASTVDTFLRHAAPAIGAWRITALDSLGMVAARSARAEYEVE